MWATGPRSAKLGSLTSHLSLLHSISQFLILFSPLEPNVLNSLRGDVLYLFSRLPHPRHRVKIHMPCPSPARTP